MSKVKQLPKFPLSVSKGYWNGHKTQYLLKVEAKDDNGDKVSATIGSIDFSGGGVRLGAHFIDGENIKENIFNNEDFVKDLINSYNKSMVFRKKLGRILVDKL